MLFTTKKEIHYKTRRTAPGDLIMPSTGVRVGVTCDVLETF